MKTKLLLHVCCGPCSLGSIQALTETYEVTLFWANSNIWPQEEHDLRRAAAREVARRTGLILLEAPWQHEAWLESVSGLEGEPERGRRCAVCFAFSFAQAAAEAARLGIGLFTSTLTVSPHKDAALIFELGKKAAAEKGVVYLTMDFKKNEGFKHSTRLSKEYGIYRQHYCGCEFSRRPR